MEDKGGERDVGHDRQEDPPPQFQGRRRQGGRDEDATHKDGNRERQRQVKCPHAHKDQRRQDHIPTPAQPAGRHAVTHDASDVDAVGGGNEPVLLLHGLSEHFTPERFVRGRGVVLRVAQRSLVFGETAVQVVEWAWFRAPQNYGKSIGFLLDGLAVLQRRGNLLGCILNRGWKRRIDGFGNKHIGVELLVG